MNIILECFALDKTYKVIPLETCHNRPCFKTTLGDKADKTFIVSIPKSGTYFIACILGKLGYVDTKIHLATWGFQDLRYCSQEEFYSHTENYTYFFEPQKQSFEDALDWVLPSQFIVGHIPVNKMNALKDFTVLFTFRDLRECLVSYMRFLETNKLLTSSQYTHITNKIEKFKKFLETDARFFVEMALPMKEWISQHPTFQIKFEDLIDEDITLDNPAVKTIAQMTLAPKEEVIKAIKSAQYTKTLTYSGQTSHYQDYWSQEAEDFFEKSGLAQMNKLFNYS